MTNNSKVRLLSMRNSILLTIGLISLFFLSITSIGQRSQATDKHHFKRENTSTKQSDKSDLWQPQPGVKWQIQLEDPVENFSTDAQIYDIDLFDNTAETITKIHQQGARVICYFSAGTYEDWRSDADQFSSSDFGSNLDDWPGERWIDINSSNVRRILTARLDMAHTKGCDGVDPDNIDAYDNDSRLGLTEADSINLLEYLSSEAHSRGMSIGLKNGGDIIGAVIEYMQWSVNEQCAEYDECDTYAAFTKVDKPVFHIEYSDGGDGGDGDDEEEDEDEGRNTKLKKRVTQNEKSKACEASGTDKFSTVIKNMELNAWVEYCY
ncbi:hypothetical protein PENSTE_c010G08052 [Penicillium steckii]|uniref:alpha-galactosidase n=1 Tax=Penicillium steckii TaxID=303698 RepID=A0A1V6T8S0_9EURO|nr:hypothetical protein PENSTE_c010G08052 [Penicillium steckii]